MRNEQKKNVYGENHPVEEERSRGLHENTVDDDTGKDTAEQFDKVRERMTEEQPPSGGMGRDETPKDGPSQGEFQGVGEDRTS